MKFMAPKTRNEFPLGSAQIACLSVTLIGILILVASVLMTDKPATYDEIHILREVSHLKEKGLSRSFLDNYRLGHGPLPVFLQYLFEPLTFLEPPGIRLVNLGFLLMLVTIQFFVLRRMGSRSPLSSSLSIVAAPMIWVMGGMALSEMPAMCMNALAVWLLMVSMEDILVKTRVVIFAILGGLALGIAIVGRQPFLLVVFALPVLLLDRRESRGELILFCLAALAFPAILFSLWGGLTAPRMVSNVEGISIFHGALSLGYGAILVLMWAPRYFHMNLRVIFLLLCILCLNMILGFEEWIPLNRVARAVFSDSLLSLYGRFIAGVFMCLGAMFLISTLRNAWSNRHDKFYLFLCIAAVFVLACAAKITVQFSSRYPGTAIPLLLLIADRYNRPDMLKAASMTLGIGAGFVSLWSYLY
jgi:hypothetical protein